MRQGKWDPRRPPARPRRAEHLRRKERDGTVVLYGWHTVTAALANPNRKFHALLATENAARRLAEDGVSLPTATHIVRAEAIAARLPPGAVHQGLLAEPDPLEAPAVEELASQGLVLVLDQVTDPHNVGAIVRSAAAFGVAAVVTTSRHSPEATGVLAKSASGALEHVPIIEVTNLARGLTTLKERGFTVIGLDSEASSDLAAMDLGPPLALVVGAEGKGLRQLTRVTCDQLARLTLPGKITSLNVSNAAAVTLFVVHSKQKISS